VERKEGECTALPPRGRKRLSTLSLSATHSLMEEEEEKEGGGPQEGRKKEKRHCLSSLLLFPLCLPSLYASFS